MNLRCLTALPGSLSSESYLALRPVTRKFGLNSGPSGCPRWVKSRHMRCTNQCPLYPRKPTCAVHLGMSAKGQ
jgi:hypothetical protein